MPVLPEDNESPAVSKLYGTFSCKAAPVVSGIICLPRIAPDVPFSALFTFVVIMKSARTPAVSKSTVMELLLTAVTVNKLLAKLTTVFGAIPEAEFDVEL